MIFAAPWVLAALAILPVLWWLLRATPPAPRTQGFPALVLLRGLRPKEETPARTPLWLLLLRMAAAALIIVGLAGGGGGGGGGLGGRGPLALVVDNDWAAAPDWSERLRAANAILDLADREKRRVALIATAATVQPREPAALLPPELARPWLAALLPMAWPADRAQAARLLAGLPPGPSVYVASGAAAPGDAALARVLARRGAVTELRGDKQPALLTAGQRGGALAATLDRLPGGAGETTAVLAETGDGRVLARSALTFRPEEGHAEAVFDLPPEFRNQLADLRLTGVAGAGGVVLLDESARRRPVGIFAEAGGDTPLLGGDFYVERALAPFAEVRRGDLAALLSRPLSVLVVADRALSDAEAARISKWVAGGGFLVRFAGPAAAMGHDDLLPEKLLANDRQLGGTMSWSQPQHLAPFPSGPFAGLTVPDEVTVSRQVLADPEAAQPPATWARLRDGTPLVTAAGRGNGEVVLFHVTANTDWSTLPLAGLFVDMLRRIVQRAAGITQTPPQQVLPPAETLSGAGVLQPPPPGALGMTLAAMATTAPGPAHPPGFYGIARDRHAFNLGGHLALAAAAVVAGAEERKLGAEAQPAALGPWLLAAALALLCLDLVLTLRLRGLLRPAAIGLLVAAAVCGGARAQQSPALATHLAYVVTGDAAVDGVSKAGLSGLSDYVNDHTAAVLAPPLPVTPGRDDLSFYPLLYWPITADAAVPAGFDAALNDYMRHGGIVLIDTRSGGAGGTFAPGADAALQRVSAGLDVPALTPLSIAHVLAKSFYLLTEFPGRYEGAPVWVQRDQDRTNDGVSPVIIGANDWAAAWATDNDGNPLYATIPGGNRQRLLAWRFGVNLVMYALTGNYKGDQVHVPAILQRLSQ
jgi:hypothetical protein